MFKHNTSITVYRHIQLQWNPSITDTIGTSKCVLLIEVSFVEGSFNIIKYQNGTSKVSLVVRCPLFRGALYKGFHCITIVTIPCSTILYSSVTAVCSSG